LDKVKRAWNWSSRAKKWAWKVASFATETGRAISQAEVSKREGEAKKANMEAESIAAECNHKKQQTVKIVNEEIERIFSQDDQPEMSKRLQLANLLAENPQIAEKFKLLEELSFMEEKATSGLMKRPDPPIVGIEGYIPE
jgi:hypothetical protein